MWVFQTLHQVVLEMFGDINLPFAKKNQFWIGDTGQWLLCVIVVKNVYN